MKLLGLTGGVGMGKSTVADLLRSLGLPVVDTDQLARELVAPGQPALEEIRTAFGPEVVDETGVLRRDRLAEKVFSDSAARRRLEAILHPRIREQWLAAADVWRVAGKRGGVVVIPLLFETDAQGHFDATICVACTPASQRERLRARGWSNAEIDRRCAAQWPIERKMAAADYVVWTEGDLAATRSQLLRILDRIFPARRVT